MILLGQVYQLDCMIPCTRPDTTLGPGIKDMAACGSVDPWVTFIIFCSFVNFTQLWVLAYWYIAFIVPFVSTKHEIIRADPPLHFYIIIYYLNTRYLAPNNGNKIGHSPTCKTVHRASKDWLIIDVDLQLDKDTLTSPPHSNSRDLRPSERFPVPPLASNAVAMFLDVQ
jgi:hypothetical protein